MSTLLSPTTLGALELGNRIVVSPMCQYSSNAGEANVWHTIHLGQLALSGAGLLCIEATAVEAQGRITPADLGLWNDATEAALAITLASIREVARVPIAIQLAHAGRKASCEVPWQGGGAIAPTDARAWTTMSASALPHNPGDPTPVELDQQGMRRVCDAFATAAMRSGRMGLDAIELHAAHGYLLHQFLSPLSNARTDAYGGSLENRMRFPLEVFAAVRESFPRERPVGVRISATDWMAGGWDVAQSIAFTRQLQALGVDFIDVSSGGISPLQKVAVSPGYQVGFSRDIRKATGVATIAVGLITNPRQAEAILAAGDADFIALARGLLYDPRWPWHAAAEFGETIAAPLQYLRSAPREHAHLLQPPDKA